MPMAMAMNVTMTMTMTVPVRPASVRFADMTGLPPGSVSIAARRTAHHTMVRPRAAEHPPNHDGFGGTAAGFA